MIIATTTTRRFLSVLGAMLCCLGSALAVTPDTTLSDSASATSEAPITVADWIKSLQLKGAVDFYYKYDYADKPANGLTSFTRSSNSFELGMANLILSQNKGKVGFTVDVAVGKRADEANGSSGSSVLIKQLFVSYKATDWLTLTGGNFLTFIGYEGIDVPANFFYSTSYMFTTGPFYHTGIKADMSLGKGFTAMVGLFNKTDMKYDVSKSKYYGAQLGYTNGGVSMTLGTLMGRNAMDQHTYQYDLVGRWQATEQLYFGTNLTYIHIVPEAAGRHAGFNNDYQKGAALYTQYQFTPTFALGARAEHYQEARVQKVFLSDTDEAVSGGVNAFTMSANIKLGQLTLIPELRYDRSNREIFGDREGMAAKQAGSALLAVYYAF